MKKVFVKIGTVFVKTGTIVGRFFGAVEKVDEIYHALTPEAKAAAIKTFQDGVTLVVAAEAAGAAGGTNLPLDLAVIAAVKNLYADALADGTAAKKVFAVLGVSIPAPAQPLPKAA